jgi:signal transduction histidine kinase
VWQIVTVAVLGLRVKSVFVPLVLRAGIIMIFAIAAVVLRAAAGTKWFQVSQVQRIDQVSILLPALLLLCVAALASLPLPTSVPPVIPPLAETLTSAVIVGGVSQGGPLFLPYLTVPLFIAGLTAGLSAGLACAGLASVTLLATLASASETGGSELLRHNDTLVAWLFIFVAVPAVGAWIRRIRNEVAPDSEPAYTDAHRLLSELHVVARQLSLGLDPRTLAAALVEDIRAVIPNATAAVLTRSPGGRFVALAGEEPDDTAEAVIEDAWVGAHPVKRVVEQCHFTVLPVLMGERVVALMAVTAGGPSDDASIRRCRAVIEQSGPRLASAMLFDDVRRLATTDERMRLAREIHDGIAQDLASVGYALDDIRYRCEPAVAEQVTGVREQLQTMVADLRMSIFDLRTGINDSIGLGTAISEHAQRIAGQSELAVHFSMDESPKRLPITVEVELLRIAQEAITNVRRHARAKNLWLSVTVEPPRAFISVTDDGRGLKPGRPDSFGITGMRERARRIGAHLNVATRPEGGTLVEVGLGAEPAMAQRPLARPSITRDALTDPRGIPTVDASADPNVTSRTTDLTTTSHGAIPLADHEVTT